MANVGNRRSLRLQGHNYAREGAYFVTICVQGRQCLLGEIADGAMRMNEAGCMVEHWWREIGNKWPFVKTDRYIVMPNHIHGIVVITNDENQIAPKQPVGADLCVCPTLPICPTRPDDATIVDERNDGTDAYGDGQGTHVFGQGAHGFKKGAHTGAPLQGGVSLSRVVQWFKTMTTNAYILGVNTRDWPPFDGQLWQRDYFDRIIRDDREMAHIVNYVNDNPRHWKEDEENPGTVDIV